MNGCMYVSTKGDGHRRCRLSAPYYPLPFQSRSFAGCETDGSRRARARSGLPAQAARPASDRSVPRDRCGAWRGLVQSGTSGVKGESHPRPLPKRPPTSQDRTGGPGIRTWTRSTGLLNIPDSTPFLTPVVARLAVLIYSLGRVLQRDMHPRAAVPPASHVAHF